MMAMVASLVGGALLLAAIIAAIRKSARGPACVPYIFGLAVAGAILIRPELYDRYQLAILPSALIAAAVATGSTRLGIAIALFGVGLYAGWSFYWERDYLAREAAVWQVGRGLVERGIPTDQIDGGFEWNGWYRGDDIVADVIQAMDQSPNGELWTIEIARRLLRSDTPWYIDFAIRDKACPDRVIDVKYYGYGERHPVFGLERCPP